ncbi:MAG: hypothetical protein EOP56_02605 [Sphingobacteriales bacterium]|nr:MAG: hypothetical protein EOP56_02605 [Sphingobacteriales bacterium]
MSNVQNRRVAASEGSKPSHYFIGWVLILSTIAYWVTDESETAPTIVNKVSVLSSWALSTHIILTTLGLVLLWRSDYSKEIANKVSLRFYETVKLLHERDVTSFSVEKSGETKDPWRSTYNIVKASLLILTGLFAISVFFAFMQQNTDVPSFSIVLLIVFFPILLIWWHIKKLDINDTRTMKNRMYEDFDMSKGTAAIKVLDNQIAYIKLTNDNHYKKIGFNQTEIISGTTCRIFDYSYFSIRNPKLHLYAGAKSKGSQLVITLNISPDFSAFPVLLTESQYGFTQVFNNDEDSKRDEIYGIIPEDLVLKSLSSINQNIIALQRYDIPEGKTEKEVNKMLNDVFDTSIYDKIAEEIRSLIAKSFNERLGTHNAFNVQVTVDDHLDRDAFASETQKKYHAYAERERARNYAKEDNSIAHAQTVELAKIDVLKAAVEKGALSQDAQQRLVYTITNSDPKQHTYSLPVNPSVPNQMYIDSYAKELIDAHEHIMLNPTDSDDAKIEYLQSKSIFRDYPRIRPIDVYQKLREMDRQTREVKMRDALRELISTISNANG